MNSEHLLPLFVALPFGAALLIPLAGFVRKGLADIIAVVDPMTSQISPEHFRKFVTPAINSIFDHIRQRNALSSIFVCGDVDRNLECMCETACDNISVD